MTTAAVLLAAGGGQRFRGQTHKLLAMLRGRPVLEWSVEHALAAELAETIIVVGAVPFQLSALTTVVVNPHWHEGQATSLAAAIDLATAHGHDAVVVGLGDQPFVPASAWRAVAASSSPIAVATYGGVRGPNPVRLAAEVWPLLTRQGDEGARSVIGLRSDLVEEVACEGTAADIDTVEDLGQWNS